VGSTALPERDAPDCSCAVLRRRVIDRGLSQREGGAACSARTARRRAAR
jgi:hypothetical protein